MILFIILDNLVYFFKAYELVRLLLVTYNYILKLADHNMERSEDSTDSTCQMSGRQLLIGD